MLLPCSNSDSVSFGTAPEPAVASKRTLTPTVREVFGIRDQAGPITEGSAVVEYDFGLAPPPTTNIPAFDGEDPHDKVRVLKPAMDQLDEFLRNGDIKASCDGPCNPT